MTKCSKCGHIIKLHHVQLPTKSAYEPSPSFREELPKIGTTSGRAYELTRRPRKKVNCPHSRIRNQPGNPAAGRCLDCGKEW